VAKSGFATGILMANASTLPQVFCGHHFSNSHGSAFIVAATLPHSLVPQPSFENFQWQEIIAMRI